MVGLLSIIVALVSSPVLAIKSGSIKFTNTIVKTIEYIAAITELPVPIFKACFKVKLPFSFLKLKIPKMTAPTKIAILTTVFSLPWSYNISKEISIKLKIMPTIPAIDP